MTAQLCGNVMKCVCTCGNVHMCKSDNCDIHKKSIHYQKGGGMDHDFRQIFSEMLAMLVQWSAWLFARGA